MVGRPVYFWDGLFSGAVLVSGSVVFRTFLDSDGLENDPKKPPGALRRCGAVVQIHPDVFASASGPGSSKGEDSKTFWCRQVGGWNVKSRNFKVEPT